MYIIVSKIVDGKMKNVRETDILLIEMAPFLHMKTLDWRYIPLLLYIVIKKFFY